MEVEKPPGLYGKEKGGEKGGGDLGPPLRGRGVLDPPHPSPCNRRKIRGGGYLLWCLDNFSNTP